MPDEPVSEGEISDVRTDDALKTYPRKNMNGTQKKNMSRTDILRELVQIHNNINNVRLDIVPTESAKLEIIRVRIQKLIESV